MMKILLRPYFRISKIGLRSPDQTIIVPPEAGGPTVFLKRWREMFRLLISPELAFCEGYANGHIDIENGDIYGVIMQFYDANIQHPKLAKYSMFLAKPFMYFYQGLNWQKSKANVAAHYDLGNDLYKLFLDPDMQYSCAYFHNSNDDLTTAQQQKKDHIINKLLPEKGMTALDIGCGWGGLSLDLARHGMAVTGITLSEEQFATAEERGRASGHDVKFKLQDYRHENSQYDRIASVGMFEHVGKACFQEYFNQVARNLKDDGIALIHTIGRPTPPISVNRFTTKYIFPGGYIPSLSQIVTVAERTDLLITDVECLYLHYAETLRHWRLNFMENRANAVNMYDERFARIWEVYLAGSEANFRAKYLLVYQVQLRKRKSLVNLTRDYLYKSD